MTLLLTIPVTAYSKRFPKMTKFNLGLLCTGGGGERKESVVDWWLLDLIWIKWTSSLKNRDDLAVDYPSHCL